MKFSRTTLPGFIEIQLDRHGDERGYFARIYCEQEFSENGLRTPMRQDSLSFNKTRGTLRGLHFHDPEFPQCRVIRCIEGSLFLVALDLRRGSPTSLQHATFELSAENGNAYYTPPGIALGYQTLQDNTLLLYQMPELYRPEYERGVRWNDPAFGIRWPIENATILARDDSYPDFASE